ncbi:MAG: hypothetical protein FK734_08705 [Asgard group archaeon]|nr:hypothetical protein [Asgard group archaeon]
MNDLKKKFLKKIKSGNYKSIAIIGHSSVDPDSIASAFGLSYILNSLHPKAQVDILVDGISKHTSQIISYYNHPYLEETNKVYDLIVIVDVNVQSQIGSFLELIERHNKNSIIIIDHHTPTKFANENVSLAFIDEERTSVSEMIVELIFELRLKPDIQLLNVLLAGIIYDSRRFYSLNEKLLRILNELFKGGDDYDIANKLIQKKMDDSERIARIKCASRTKMKRINSFIFVWSKVGSHEGTSARALLDIGADAAFIISHRKKETRLIIRAKPSFYKDTNIHFGKDVMPVLNERFNGDGGGHSTAAAITIPSLIKEEELMKVVFNILEKSITNN